MSPGGYLRGTVDLAGPPEIRDRAHPFPRSVFIALLFLGLLQVGCTLGLFFYVKAQVEPNCMTKKELECWKSILKMREAPPTMDTFGREEGIECEGIQLAFNGAVEKALQGLISQKQLHIGNDIMQDPILSRSHNYQTWPAAHLTLGSSTAGDSAIVHLRSWNHKEGWANIQNMSYNNGTLKVLQDGFYFVYANICFRNHKMAQKLPEKTLQLMLYVCKSNKSGLPPEYLLKGGSTAMWSNDSVYNFYSVYQGGIFRLLAGEEIFIKASNAALLDPAQEATYFGAFKVLDIHL
ncbi:tumor necrosis factor ligand superfamily member 11 [Bufo gargarizans]|uniref:tumor necrosis factor ligand superfamily member 11 n=1 Tax=Bufo gargarizans TaxID=30331 RepID=UPI001CF3B15F|nr:tumor necrosis factor ligand superfamily member 11 [Bufo gargarizans]